jgi:hypothetical protein
MARRRLTAVGLAFRSDNMYTDGTTPRHDRCIAAIIVPRALIWPDDMWTFERLKVLIEVPECLSDNRGPAVGNRYHGPM